MGQVQAVRVESEEMEALVRPRSGGERSEPERRGGTNASASPGDAASGKPPAPDPEVPSKRLRRRFSATYKRRILEQVDGCGPGRIAALLRREGLYSSHLTTWKHISGRLGKRPAWSPVSEAGRRWCAMHSPAKTKSCDAIMTGSRSACVRLRRLSGSKKNFASSWGSRRTARQRAARATNDGLPATCTRCRDGGGMSMHGDSSRQLLPETCTR